MKALVKNISEKGIWLKDVAKPVIKTNDVMIKITHTSICGTDLHIYKWDDWAKKTIKTPLVIGHEFCGEICEIGAGVKNLKVGDRVSGEGHLTCGNCRNCRAGKRHLCHKTIGIGVHRDGAFAEYLSLPESNVWPIHNDISSEIASFFDPLGNAVHTALSFDITGEDVLITGAGPIGLMCVAICRYSGAKNVVITDINEYRLAIAKELGASKTINIKNDSIDNHLEKLGIKYGFDVGLEVSGNPTAFNSMLTNMYHGGSIALLGILPNNTKIDWDDVIFKGLKIKGIYGREMYETWHKMVQILRGGLNVKKILTHTFSVINYQEAFDILDVGQCGKVVLEW
tara:strand:+ start:2663 stop:3685 length:1023 start_codon:yes stop_codon:yes gene_type:complete